MLVKATRKGYYGDRIREPGRTFNYTPADEKAFKAGKEKLPSWMELVKVDSSIDPAKARNDKLAELSQGVTDAKQNLADAEAAAAAADEKLSNAKTKADKEVASDEAVAANEDVDAASIKLEEAEDALAAAES